MKPINGLRFGSAEDPREPYLETRRLLARRHLFSGGCDFFDSCETPRQLDCRTLDICEPSRLDCLTTSYPTLALFALPLVLLEPVKPMAAYLVGTGYVATGLIILVVGELLKLVLVERLFSVSRDKLMSIPAFAYAYFKYSAAKDWVTSMEAWQVVRRWNLIAHYVIRSYALKLKAAQRPRRITFQSR